MQLYVFLLNVVMIYFSLKSTQKIAPQVCDTTEPPALFKNHMRGICLSKENALFFGIALRHMNSVYNKPAQEVAPTGPPGKVPGLPRLRTFVTPGTFLGDPVLSKRIFLCRL